MSNTGGGAEERNVWLSIRQERGRAAGGAENSQRLAHAHFLAKIPDLTEKHVLLRVVRQPCDTFV